MKPIYSHLAKTLNLSLSQVEEGLTSLKHSATPEFIARYRSQEAKALTEQQLQQLAVQHAKLEKLATRKSVIETTLRHLEKLNPSLHEKIASCTDPVALEQLYAPFKPCIATSKLTQDQHRAVIEWRDKLNLGEFASHEALQEAWHQSDFSTPQAAEAALIQVLLEQATDLADWILNTRDLMLASGEIHTTFIGQNLKSQAKYRDFDAHQEPMAQLEPCRTLTILAGRREAALQLNIKLPAETILTLKQALAQQLVPHAIAGIQSWVQAMIEQLWSQTYAPHIHQLCYQSIKQTAEANILEDLKIQTHHKLLAKAYPEANVLGVYPGLKTGVKLAVINSKHELKHHAIIHPHAPQNAWQKGKRTLKQLITMGKINLIATCQNEGAYETYQFLKEVIQELPETDIEIKMVSNIGLSGLAHQSEVQQEWAHLDVHLRCAGLLAKRVRQPLTEWFRVSPKMMADNPYLAELNPVQTEQMFNEIIQHAVHRQNHDLNQISVTCLQRISGLNAGLAYQILDYKARHGVFKSRQDLLKVPFMTTERFEQCAGFLAVHHGDEPLDTTQVHPESYAAVHKAAKATGLDLKHTLDVGLTEIQKSELALQLQAQGLTTESVTMLIKQLNSQHEQVLPIHESDSASQIIHISDLKPNMMLKGIVSNVATFGAFIDIGLAQKGLIHISEMGERFIDDPRKFIKTGDFVKVKVTEIDMKRERINLSMKLRSQTSSKVQNSQKKSAVQAKSKPERSTKPLTKHNLKNEAMASAFADAFAKFKN
jgi:uncharacterized protein